MQISERVYLAGSGRLGYELTHALDCNVYVLNGGEEWAIIDAGSGANPELIVSQMIRDQIPLPKLKKLLLTHVHADHAAGAYGLRERFQLEVTAAAEAAEWLRTGDQEKSSAAAAIRAGIYPQDFSYHPCPVDAEAREGDLIRVGDLSLKVLETPGHSRGHVSYLLEKAGISMLFSGDLLFAGGKVVLQNTWDCSIPEMASSVYKLQQYDVDRLYPGHGPFLLRHARDHIERAAQQFRQLQIPPGL